MHQSNAAPVTAVTDVLIIGAGPTGLILAHELLRRSIRVRLVEKRPHPSSTTRAFTLHARTMEMFDHQGLAARIDELREICPGNLFHFKEMPLAKSQAPMLDFRRLRNTRYNYYGKVNQNDLDQALRESLAAKYSVYPEFGVEYIGSTQDTTGVTVHLQHTAAANREEITRAKWLVGADGAQSAVRGTLGTSFEQQDGQRMSMSMVDAQMSGFTGDAAWVNYFVSAKGFMLVTGLPGQKYRLYLAGEMAQLLQHNSPLEAFQQGLDFFATGAQIERLEWSSSWEIRKIIGETYRTGRILLCGDATHVHSPAGGQGMNACMQDAFNLGWKLALQIHGRAQAAILDTYPAERRPIAEQVTAGADRMHQILFNATLAIEQRYQLTQDPSWHDEAIQQISALSHNYRGVDGAVAGISLQADSVWPGDRAPDCGLSAAAPVRRLYDVLRHPGFTLLLIPGSNAATLQRCAELGRAITRRFGRNVKPVVVHPTTVEGFDYDHTALDRSSELQHIYGATPEGQMIVVRPDLYVGFRGSLHAQAELDAYFSKWLIGE